jgi:hypothetical protein
MNENKKRQVAEWKAKNKDRIREWGIAYREKNKEQIRARKKEYREKNKERINAIGAMYREKMDKEAVREYKKRYREANRDLINKKGYDYYKSNIQRRLSVTLRNRLRELVLPERRNHKYYELVGCTIAEVKHHIESKFWPGMSWDNHGVNGWHIDHIIPCAAFDLTKEDEQRKCFHYTNLQPLWAKDNISKKDKILWQKDTSY